MFKSQLSIAVLITSLFFGFAQSTTATEQQSIVSLKQAINTATLEVGGDVIKTEITEYNGKAVYIIRLVNEGHVKEILIDSLSGEIVKPEME